MPKENQAVISRISTKTSNTKSGFSLVEIVVALAISGIATLAMVNLFRSFLISSARKESLWAGDTQMGRPP